MTNVRRARALTSFASLIIAASAFASAGAHAQGSDPAKPADTLSVSVSMGDVSLTKLPFIMAADNGTNATA